MSDLYEQVKIILDLVNNITDPQKQDSKLTNVGLLGYYMAWLDVALVQNHHHKQGDLLDKFHNYLTAEDWVSIIRLVNRLYTIYR